MYRQYISQNSNLYIDVHPNNKKNNKNKNKNNKVKSKLAGKNRKFTGNYL
jgi:hypothetical protein